MRVVGAGARHLKETPPACGVLRAIIASALPHDPGLDSSAQREMKETAVRSTVRHAVLLSRYPA